jgi:serine/threonine protein phosphatase PrpC
MKTELFDYQFSAGSALDIGVLRDSNQDRVILCGEIGFFAVSDGMGGLAQGGKTSEIIAEVLPGIVEGIVRETRGKRLAPERAGELLAGSVRMISDNIYDTVNTGGIGFGATLSCVWLIGGSAVYVNLGDSRGYLLPRYRRTLRQVTEDHNVAGELVRLGELSREEAQGHPASSRLTQFMGMPAPAHPEVFVLPVAPGDRILLCSDGLHGMLADGEIRGILRRSRWQGAICRRLAAAANEAGGHDNISAVTIKVLAEG